MHEIPDPKWEGLISCPGVTRFLQHNHCVLVSIVGTVQPFPPGFLGEGGVRVRERGEKRGRKLRGKKYWRRIG